MNTDKHNWVEIYYLVILLITGLSLRFFRLGNESFSPLEASYIAALSKNFNNLLVYLITHKNISFCFSFAGFLWLKLFSYSEYSARLLSVLFGIGGILFCFKSLRFFYRSKISFFISLFLCCSPLYVQISQQFSPYAMLFFFVTLNIFVFCSIVKRSETKFLNWMYIISGLIAVNSNYICALIFIPQFWLLYNYNNGKKVFYRKKTWVVSIFIIVFITVLIFCIFENFSAKKLFLPIPTVNLYQLIISFI
ncbi:glycosyltransferase family 39 protein, partial [bacterium]|nr:glycosyltransferase family 39 protein [bacterium]